MPVPLISWLLRWKISGDEDYAKAAIKILNGWAKTCKGVNYKTYFDDSHRLLAAGFIGYQFAAPAELMRDYEGWAGKPRISKSSRNG